MNRIDKATIAPVPGTTLNLLKFPILRPEPGQLSLRHDRLKDDQKVINNMEQERIDNLRKFKSIQVSFILFRYLQKTILFFAIIL